MNIDVATTVKVILGLLAIFAVISIFMAVKSIKAGHKLLFYQKRQLLIYHGWRLVLLALGLLLSGFLIFRFGEPLVYRYFPPSPTITLTPTITITPTVTNTPSMTYTPTITLTLSQTYTPALPDFIQATIQTPVGPDASAIFSPLSFSDTTEDGVVTESLTEFDLPVSTLFGGFSYDRMAVGVQWTAVWLYGEEIICSETKAWDYAPGGYGYTDCTRPVEAWLPGVYEVRIFVGQTWKVSGTFRILGEEPLISDIPTATGAQPPDEAAVTSTPEPPAP
ncbi:MAG TPA: hypothetical protein PKK59_05445 [Anaerolineaceae bacterium]|nr:hypothetical protein [Anaerolineaceae bacterium]